ncbi:unnamed protein product [Camellia sinensis]
MIETEIDSKERGKERLISGGGSKMDEFEFQRILNLFPVVRPRDYHLIWICQVLGSNSYSKPNIHDMSMESIPGVHLTGEVDSASSSQSTAQSAHNDMGTWGGADVKEIPIQGTGPHDAFWRKLRMAAEKKVGAAEAEKFCKAFQIIHRQLVYEELSLAAASSILSSSQSSEEE